MSDAQRIIEEIERRKGLISKLKMETALQEAELRGLEAALALFLASSKHGARREEDVVDDTELEDGGAPGSRMSEKWRSILRILGERLPKAASLEDIRAAAAERGYDIRENTLRAHLASYAKIGFVDRVGPGEYRITKMGASAADISSAGSGSRRFVIDLSGMRADPPGQSD